MIIHFGNELCKVANDRTRLMIALEITLSRLGVSDFQIKKIVTDVRSAKFESLKKTLKIDS